MFKFTKKQGELNQFFDKFKKNKKEEEKKNQFVIDDYDEEDDIQVNQEKIAMSKELKDKSSQQVKAYKGEAMSSSDEEEEQKEQKKP